MVTPIQGHHEHHKDGAYSISPKRVDLIKGLHGRPCTEIALMFAQRCKEGVYVSRTDKPGTWYDAASVCSLMNLMAEYGVQLRFSFVNQDDASPKLLEDLEWLLKNDGHID